MWMKPLRSHLEILQRIQRRGRANALDNEDGKDDSES